jgi:nucleoside-diphosphate-sugar epimerase
MRPLPPDARFVLTGPSGWIGHAMLAHLARRSGGLLAGRVILFASAERSMSLASGECLPVRALETIHAADVAGAHVIHLAYLTKEKAADLGERHFTDANLAIDDAVLAALREDGAASVFVASSGAAQQAARGIDLHPYGLAKLRQEARFLEWGKAAGVPVLAGRIFNIAGPHINKLEAYAVSNFALQAIRTGKITVQAAIPVFRSFLHVDDLCALVVAAGVEGTGRARPIDLCGGEVVEMGDIAARVAALSGGSAVERGSIEHGRSSAYLGDFTDTRILAMELGIDLAPLLRQIEDTIRWIANEPDREVRA